MSSILKFYLFIYIYLLKVLLFKLDSESTDLITRAIRKTINRKNSYSIINGQTPIKKNYKKISFCRSNLVVEKFCDCYFVHSYQ